MKSAAGAASLGLLVAGCQPPLTIAFETPKPPPATVAAEGNTTSFNCFEASTPAERMACSDRSLAQLDLATGRAFHSALRESDLFGRDVVLAGQVAWAAALTSRCGLGDGTEASPEARSCLARAYRERAATLSAWPKSQPGPAEAAAIAQYVVFKPTMQRDPALCTAIASGANASLGAAGSVDPARFPTGAELAGSHGPKSATIAGQRFEVAEHDANVFGGYQRRATGLRIDDSPVLDSLSLGDLVRTRGSNRGGRFSAFASQTGDYASIDVFSRSGQVLALATDPWGFYAPASAGEFVQAGVWLLNGAAASPACLFDIYRTPPDHGAFDALPAFPAWRDQLHRIASDNVGDAGVTALRDQSQLRAETEWMVLNAPLVVRAQALSRFQGGADWNAWLRHRHDQVLDALLAWSRRAPDSRAAFAAVFQNLRPVAQELVTTYQQTQGLTAVEAKQAGALAVIEFLYGAAAGISPGLGGALDVPPGPPRYGILATPG